MRRHLLVSLSALLVLAACSSSSTSNGNSHPAVVDASPDSPSDGAVPRPDGGDASTQGLADADIEAGYSCSPPAATTTTDDAGGGCAPHPGIYVNDVNACKSNEYAVVCNDFEKAPVPASLQCEELPLPTAPGVAFYCCPCAATES